MEEARKARFAVKQEPPPVPKRSFAWTGGKISSNKDEATVRFLKRQLDAGKTLTASQEAMWVKVTGTPSAEYRVPLAAAPPKTNTPDVYSTDGLIVGTTEELKSSEARRSRRGGYRGGYGGSRRHGGGRSGGGGGGGRGGGHRGYASRDEEPSWRRNSSSTNSKPAAATAAAATAASSAPGSGSGSGASGATGEEAEAFRTRRYAKKKLREIEALEAKPRESLDVNQLAKLEKKMMFMSIAETGKREEDA